MPLVGRSGEPLGRRSLVLLHALAVVKADPEVALGVGVAHGGGLPVALDGPRHVLRDSALAPLQHVAEVEKRVRARVAARGVRGVCQRLEGRHLHLLIVRFGGGLIGANPSPRHMAVPDRRKRQGVRRVALGERGHVNGGVFPLGGVEASEQRVYSLAGTLPIVGKVDQIPQPRHRCQAAAAAAAATGRSQPRATTVYAAGLRTAAVAVVARGMV
mmetsp:Transcript_32304/g.72939  ORF Transcript_32304/g.72939 Transcript_32304/m.72939 type:complete len:215 (+) Transcript_32304:571-1215(+)